MRDIRPEQLALITGGETSTFASIAEWTGGAALAGGLLNGAGSREPHIFRGRFVRGAFFAGAAGLLLSGGIDGAAKLFRAPKQP